MGQVLSVIINGERIGCRQLYFLAFLISSPNLNSCRIRRIHMPNNLVSDGRLLLNISG
jgi:hypothetical protein